LPLRAAPLRGTDLAPHPQAAERLEGMRVLLVDDDRDSRELVSFILQQHGTEVVSASSGDEAMSALGSCRPEVLICNIAMPGMDRYELIRCIRKLSPEESGWIPAVALTAYASVEDRRKAMLCGYQMHVPKPISAERLVRIIAGMAGWQQQTNFG
jgi:CheY-like chemotaxis protein